MRNANLGRKLSAAHRAKLKAARRNRVMPLRTVGHPWKPEWDSLLGTMFDKDLAAMLGVPLVTVWRKRRALGVPSYRRSNGR
jgi:hypothetical protein